MDGELFLGLMNQTDVKVLRVHFVTGARWMGGLALLVQTEARAGDSQETEQCHCPTLETVQDFSKTFQFLYYSLNAAYRSETSWIYILSESLSNTSVPIRNFLSQRM